MRRLTSSRWWTRIVPKLPGVKVKDAIRAFEKAGFRVARHSGHVVMTNGRITISIPRGNPINPFTMAGIVVKAGMTIPEFKAFL